MSKQGIEHRFEDSHKYTAEATDTSSHLQQHAHHLLKEHSIVNGQNYQKAHVTQILEFNPIKGFDPEKAMQTSANFIKQGASELGKQADRLGKAFDETPIGKKINEVTHNDPAEKITLGLAAGSAAVVGTIILAPEAAAAAGIASLGIAGPEAVGLMMGSTYQLLHQQNKNKR